MSELFSEVYNCYFQVIKSLIEAQKYISKQEVTYRIQKSGFEESLLTLLPKLTEKGWGFYENDKTMFCSKLSTDFYVPLTDLQKSYLKAILMDDKIALFLDDDELTAINAALGDVTPLYRPEDFYYYDRFADEDDYQNPTYKKHFRMIQNAIERHQYLDIAYESRFGHRVHHYYLPCRLEYSMKNDCFRLLAVNRNVRRSQRVEILNLSRIHEITKSSETAAQIPNINQLLRRSYYKEPVRILIKDRRNALERAMLQFANYEKFTRKIDDNTYECLIYYNKKTETELLIEILSFGPMIKVVGNDGFVRLIKERLSRQAKFLNYSEKTKGEQDNVNS